MIDKWTASESLVALLKERFADPHVREMLEGHEEFYPTIGWTDGATLQKRGESPTTVTSHYGLGFMFEREASGYLEVDAPYFEMILFRPSKEDAASSRRVIDYDGTDIVVR